MKALALGADGVALSNSALQAIGCLGMRACHTNNCPVGIATQKDPSCAPAYPIQIAAKRLQPTSSSPLSSLMQVLARACGHTHTSISSASHDLTTWKRYGGVAPIQGVNA